MRASSKMCRRHRLGLPEGAKACDAVIAGTRAGPRCDRRDRAAGTSLYRVLKSVRTCRRTAGGTILRKSNIVVALVSTLSMLAGITVACVNVDYEDRAFRCDPAGAEPRCPDEFFCCSDDPAALTMNGDDPTSTTSLPAYGDETPGEERWAKPIFSGDANNRSRSGMCTRLGTDELMLESGVAAGCPIPCNPTWTDDDVEAVCGVENAVCCQTVELTEEDCVKDQNGCYRPATGADVYDSNIDTQWEASRHRTHQDPAGIGCKAEFSDSSDGFRECVRRLTVANQRGFCIAPTDSGDRRACPLAHSNYIDACEALNNGNSDCE